MVSLTSLRVSCLVVIRYKRRAAAGVDLFHAAGAGGGQHLAGAEQAVGVERVAEACHHVQVVVGEQLCHEVDLLDADAVLAGDAAAAVDALVEDLVAGGEHALAPARRRARRTAGSGGCCRRRRGRR